MRPIVKTVSSVSTSDPIRVNWRGGRGGFALSIGVDLNPGSLTYTVQHTFDPPDKFSESDYKTNATWRNTAGLTGLTANGEGNIVVPVQAVRLNVTAYSSGSAEITVTQSS